MYNNRDTNMMIDASKSHSLFHAMRKYVRYKIKTFGKNRKKSKYFDCAINALLHTLGKIE